MIEELTGGRSGIQRLNGTVIRPASQWSPQIHRLLRHVRGNGFLIAPDPIEIRTDGTEVVSFIDGEVSNYPLSEAARSETALVTAAKLLRAYHEATLGFQGIMDESLDWMLPARLPRIIMCHGDFAPYNTVLRGETAIGLIDFDTAHPGPREWDIAYGLYRWSAFHHPETDGVFGSSNEQIQRAVRFCEAYGLDAIRPISLSDMMSERLEAMLNFMTHEAEAGNEVFQANIRDGHHKVYIRDRQYIRDLSNRIDDAIAAAHG